MTADEAIDLTSVREVEKQARKQLSRIFKTKISKLEKTKRNIKTCDY